MTPLSPVNNLTISSYRPRRASVTPLHSSPPWSITLHISFFLTGLVFSIASGASLLVAAGLHHLMQHLQAMNGKTNPAATVKSPRNKRHHHALGREVPVSLLTY
ncbi:hypothetical protein FALCPG4_010271 [Fusarium falciforme]